MSGWLLSNQLTRPRGVTRLANTCRSGYPMMLKPAFICALLAVAGTAHASDDFAARVARATKVERSSPVGRDYLMRFMPETNAAFEDVVGGCFKNGKIGEKEAFTVVFDIDAVGSIINVALSDEAQSEHALCYAKGIGNIKAPPPPKAFADEGFPIVIHMSHTFR